MKLFYLANGDLPPLYQRVLVTRTDGKKIIARLDYKPDAIFRNKDEIHWLNDDDKFIDVPFNKVICWEKTDEC